MGPAQSQRSIGWTPILIQNEEVVLPRVTLPLEHDGETAHLRT